jgi:hypothetical protein
VKRDPDMDALAEAIAEAQTDRPSPLARSVRRALVKAFPFALFSGAAGVLLARTGVNLGQAYLVLLYGSPVLAVAVLVFAVHAWRQNSTTTVYGAGQVDQGEPGQVDQGEPGQVASEVGQVPQSAPVGQGVEVGQPATQVRPVTVTATVVDLPVPVAITGQPTASYYSPIPERDETKEEIA